MQNVRVVVIGAGASGLSAVSKFLEKGFKNITLLEAENRIGGRIYTTDFANNVLDLGAQWCHGEEDNSVYELVKDHKVLEEASVSYPNVNFVRSSGINVSGEQCESLIHLCMKILETSKEELKNVKGSLGSYVLKRYQEALGTPEYSGIDSALAFEVLEHFHKFENSIEASETWFDTSANGYTHYKECNGHPLLNWKDKGYKTVFDFITKKRPNYSEALDVESKIKFNKEVTNIAWKNQSGEHVTVKCSDGTTYDADHVIVTVSLGVLKENFQSLFTPQLPPVKINAIDGLSIGTVNKIFLEFDKPFWKSDWTGFSLLWTQNDSEEIRKTSQAWLEDIFGFYRVDYQPNVLCGWISGASARKMETLDDATVLDGCNFLFNKFIGSSMPLTKPVKILRSNWFTNKHFRGSYSYRSVTTDMLRTSANDLAKPLFDSMGKPTVLFAGEATHDHYFSTVHGAIESGRREAERIAGFYSSATTEEIYEIVPAVPKVENYEVIVIGAGISGLGAGQTLKNAKVNFVILEGSSRVGGRINTVEMINFKNDGKVIKVDAGAQWIHGYQNELFKFAQKHNLIRQEESEEAEGDYIREDGLKFDEFLVKKVDFKIGQLLEECEDFVDQRTNSNFNFPKSVAEYVNGKFRKEFVDKLETDDEKIQALQLLDWHRKFQIIDNSCLHFSDISAKNWGNYSFNGEDAQTHINVFNGMSSLVEKLQLELANEIKLNKIVELIYFKHENESKILIQCSDGSVFSTNNLICTFSAGFLKENHLQLFQPPLPAEHRNVIDNIGFGTINKIFLHFEQRWWEKDWKGLQLLFNEDHNDDSHWTKFISGFDVVYPAPKNTLLAWIGGKGALDVEKINDREIADECMKIIRKFLNRQEIPDPTYFYCSRWNSENLIGGAYSFTSSATDHIENWEKVLAQPVVLDDKNVILLAGEATHSEFFSTIHGAFSSGIEQAKNVLNFHDQKKTKNLSAKL